MMAHSTGAVYADFNVQSWEKSHMQNNEENNEEGGELEPVRKVRDDAIHVEDRIICMAHRLLRTLDIPSGHP
jgi:hypothetical protein